MIDLIRRLHEGNHSLVIFNGDIHCFDGKGIADLYRLYWEQPSLLQGAQVADKVIGKAAAAFMILGKVKEVFGGVVSSAAMALFRHYGVKIHVEQEVPYIINRAHNGWSPDGTRLFRFGECRRDW